MLGRPASSSSVFSRRYAVPRFIGRKEQKYARAKGLYEADRKTIIKSSQRNPILKTLYEKLPPEKAHELLHVHYPQPE